MRSTCRAAPMRWRTAYAMVRYGGTVVVCGLPAVDRVVQRQPVRSGRAGEVDPRQLTWDRACRCATFHGSSACTSEGRLPVNRLIDGYIGFDEVNAGFDKLQDVKAIRQILTPHGVK